MNSDFWLQGIIMIIFVITIIGLNHIWALFVNLHRSRSMWLSCEQTVCTEHALMQKLLWSCCESEKKVGQIHCHIFTCN